MTGPSRHLGIVSVVPSPYQRDVFRRIAARPGWEVRVFYQENAAPDSPWPRAALEPYETVLPGWVAGRGWLRSHWNWGLPMAAAADAWIINGSLTSAFIQSLMRWRLGKRPWFFWGERLRGGRGLKAWAQDLLAAPLGGCRAIAAIGERARADYSRRFPHARVLDLPYAPEVSAFLALPRPRQADGLCRFVFAGQMIPRKGIDLLLEAWPRVCEAVPGAELVLAGREAGVSGLLRAMPAAARGRVRCLGFVAPGDLPGVMASGDVFVLPSRHDGWGVVVAQAAAAGMALVLSREVGAGDRYLIEGVTGRQVPTGSVSALAEAMAAAASDPRGTQAQGEAARRAAAVWGPEQAAAKWFELLEEI